MRLDDQPAGRRPPTITSSIRSPRTRPRRPGPRQQPRTLTILPVPDYLDRPEIVARTTDNGLATSDGARWGEPLPEGLGRILAVNLETPLAKDGFIVITGERQPAVDYELFLVVDSFERDPRRHWRPAGRCGTPAATRCRRGPRPSIAS